MTVMVMMPNGGDSGVSEKSILVIRPAMPSEKKENPQVLTTIWTGGAKIYPAETMEELAQKFSGKIPLATCTAPNGFKILVNMASPQDADPPTAVDATSTKTVLFFGIGPNAPRQGVRETMDELRAVWAAANQSTTIFD